MNSYLKAALVCLLIGLSVTCLAFYANAKDVTLEVEFSMDADAAVFVTEYQLLVERAPGSGVIEKVATMPVIDTNVRIWETQVFDIPPGKSLNWYLYSLDADGDLGKSPPYPYKIIGKPIIINIRRTN